MKNEKEVRNELDKRKKEIMETFLDKTFSGFGGISLSRKKDIINCLRWVLGDVIKIEVQGRGANLSKIK